MDIPYGMDVMNGVHGVHGVYDVLRSSAGCWEDGVAVSFFSFSATLPFRTAQSRPGALVRDMHKPYPQPGTRPGGRDSR